MDSGIGVGDANTELGPRADPLSVWLTERRGAIGASESPTILGYGYSGESAWNVWARKRGLLDDKPDNEILWYGRKMQSITLERFALDTGLKVRDLGEFTFQRHPEIPWLGCTLDGLADLPEGPVVVEAKNIGHYSAKEWDADEPPLRVQIQIQHQLAVTSAVAGFAVATVGGNKLRFRRVERNDRFIDAMIDKLAQFWELVLTGTAPAVDASDGCREVLSLLHPSDNGATVDLPPESAIWDADIIEAKARSKELETFIAARENKIRLAIADATFGALPCGGCYSFKTQHRDAYSVKESDFRVLRRLEK